MTTVVAFDRLGRGLDMTNPSLTGWLLEGRTLPLNKVLGGNNVGYALDAEPAGSIFVSGDEPFGAVGSARAIRIFADDVNSVLNNPSTEILLRVTGLDFAFFPGNPNDSLATNVLGGDDTISGNRHADILRGDAGADWLRGLGGGDVLMGDAGNDTLEGSDGSNVLIGGEGTDLAMLEAAAGPLTVHVAGNWTLVADLLNANALKGIENIRFGSGGVTTLSSVTAGATSFTPSFARTDLGTSQASTQAAATYSGPVEHLVLSFLGGGAGEAVVGTVFADFINALGGDDAVDAGQGADVVDGGTGSNFITGGADGDVFFLDGRGGTTTWSTITDWEDGEQLSVWGWRPGTSVSVWEDAAGAAGFQGVTMHADLDGNGLIETSVTWTGKTRGDLPAGYAFDGLLWFT
jgi:Ca2+-binding RTX toxin-like protein